MRALFIVLRVAEANPDIAPEGYFTVAFYLVLIAGVIGGVGALVIWVSRKRDRWPLSASK